MDLGIKGKVALVTGSARGLGKIDALKFAKEDVEWFFVILIQKAFKQWSQKSKRWVELPGHTPVISPSWSR